MRKGKIRARGGFVRVRPSYSVSVSSIRRYVRNERGLRGHGTGQALSRNDIRELRKQLRDAVGFFLAQEPNSKSVPEVRKWTQRVSLLAGWLLEKKAHSPRWPRWARELGDLLEHSRSVENILLREVAYRQVPVGLRELESYLDQFALDESVLEGLSKPERDRLLKKLDDIDAKDTRLTGFHDVHRLALKKLESLDGAVIDVTSSRMPALQGLISAVLPVWQEVTGRNGWAIHQVSDRGEDWVSPLHGWLVTILGESPIPSVDQVNKAVRFQNSSE